MLAYLLQGTFVLATLAALGGGLAAWAGPTRRRWALAQAVLHGEAPGAGPRAARDVRFAAFAGATLALVAFGLALRDALRGAGVVRLALGLGMVGPLLAIAVAASGDLARQGARRWRARGRLARRRGGRGAAAAPAAAAATPSAVPATLAALGAPSPAALAATAAEAERRTDTVRAARREVERVRAGLTDDGARAALDAIDEALDEYARALAGPERRARLGGVAALARACAAPAPAPAAPGAEVARAVLGARAGATPAEVWGLADALAAVYRAHPGADAAQVAALEAAARDLAGARPAAGGAEAAGPAEGQGRVVLRLAA